jgi:predicted enzyme related to lactoylglutathione lyase
MMLKDSPILVVLPAVDIKRAKAFYTQKLGLNMMDMPVPDDSAAFECGNGTMLYIYQREEGTKAEHTAATWLVEDIDQVVKELTKKGVTFEQYNLPDLKTNELGIADNDGARSSWFKDSEGNILSVTELA